ncbi:unnamed protein product, partial [marine sediment metagenome]
MSENNKLVPPHGGVLVDQVVTDEKVRFDLVEKAKTLQKLKL